MCSMKSIYVLLLRVIENDWKLNLDLRNDNNFK